MESLGRRHDVTAVSLITPDLDTREAESAMGEYCKDVVLVQSPPWKGSEKRLLQLRSLVSRRSYERNLASVPALKRALEGLLTKRRFDIVNIEAPHLAHYKLAQAPSGQPVPRVALDEHNIEFDLARQMAAGSEGIARKVHNTVNWPKIKREELSAWRHLDGITFTSELDEQRARALVPSIRSAVISNAVDVGYFRPRPEDPPPDGCTVMFFGAINYFPNIDGVLWLLKEVWPRLSASHPKARLKIVGHHPTPEILAFRGPKIDVTGLVDDVRPHLASAAVAIVPLRMGGGTRFKILEAMAMAKPVVSTAIGAEGIDVKHEHDILIADAAADLAAAAGRVLDDAALGARMGKNGRALVEQRYSWDAVTERLERFFVDLISHPRPRR
jgi:glycosyltransferase involved in cell wall biosynthesis